MFIGVLKEIKNYEYWVGLMLGSVCELVVYGYQVIVEKNVGSVIGFIDEKYFVVGVELVDLVVVVFE